jgi:hypothetical protein
MPSLLIRVFSAAPLAAVLIGCSQAKPVGLSIEGYNYTNRFIVDFTVTDEKGSSAWGGDVLLSTPTSGGGRSTCCVMLDRNYTKPVRLRIDWTFDRVEDTEGRTIAPAVKKSAWVTVSPPYPEGAHNFEVHFYPDGHVEAMVTHWPSPPRIKLPEDRAERP